MRRLLRSFLIVIIAGLNAVAGAAQVQKADVVIYGGTCAAVTAAVQVERMGKSVIIVCPERHLGGMSSGGLGFTDVGDKSVIGGLSREFYHRIWRHYQEPSAWRWQQREAFGNRGQGTAAVDLDKRTMWVFEPHVAERVFEDFIAEHKIPVYRDEWLDRQSGVRKDGPRIVSITMLSGQTFSGRVFLDASYEGDLMAAAGVTKAICVNQEVGNVALDLRCEGFTAGLGGAVEVLSVSMDPTEIGNAVKAYLSANPDTDGVLTLGPSAAEPTMAALEEIEMLDQVTFGTFDLSPGVLQAIDEGKMLFAIDQQQYLQGYLPVVLLYLYKTNLNTVGGGLPVYTGPGFVTKDNAAAVIDLSAQGTR